jgi:hypothetical protein
VNSEERRGQHRSTDARRILRKEDIEDDEAPVGVAHEKTGPGNAFGDEGIEGQDV